MKAGWVASENERWSRLWGIFPVEEIGRPNKEYMTRIHLTPWVWWPLKNRYYLQLYHRPDEDPHPHDHPFGFRSVILMGGYVEEIWPWVETPDGKVLIKGQHPEYKIRKPGQTRYVPASTVHRIVQLLGKRTVTLLIRGPKEQDWGFYVWSFKTGPVKVPSWKYIGLPEPEKPAYE